MPECDRTALSLCSLSGLPSHPVQLVYVGSASRDQELRINRSIEVETPRRHFEIYVARQDELSLAETNLAEIACSLKMFGADVAPCLRLEKVSLVFLSIHWNLLL